MTHTNFNIPLLHQNQSQKEITLNEGLHRITSLINKVVSQTLIQLPEQVEHGYLALIAETPEENLLKYANYLAIFINDSWEFMPPHEGIIIFNMGMQKFMVFRKGKWEKLTEVM